MCPRNLYRPLARAKCAAWARAFHLFLFYPRMLQVTLNLQEYQNQGHVPPESLTTPAKYEPPSDECGVQGIYRLGDELCGTSEVGTPGVHSAGREPCGAPGAPSVDEELCGVSGPKGAPSTRDADAGGVPEPETYSYIPSQVNDPFGGTVWWGCV